MQLRLMSGTMRADMLTDLEHPPFWIYSAWREHDVESEALF